MKTLGYSRIVFAVALGAGAGSTLRSQADRPMVTVHPRETGTYIRGGMSFEVQASPESGPLAFQWKKDGEPIAGATDARLTVIAPDATATGFYTVVVANAIGAIETRPVRGLVSELSPPRVSLAQGDHHIPIPPGGSVGMPLRVSSIGPYSLQWFKDGEPIPGATNIALNASEVGVYSVISKSIMLTSEEGPYLVAVRFEAPPVFYSAPAPTTVRVGERLDLSANIQSNRYSFVTFGPKYQWRKEGVDIPGATNAWFAIAERAAPSDAGSYTVRATNTTGSIVSEPAIVRVISSYDPSREPPVIAQRPGAFSFSAGETISQFIRVVSAPAGTPEPAYTYQWRLNGAAIPGATRDSYSSRGIAGRYSVVVGNAMGSTTTEEWLVASHRFMEIPAFTRHPESAAVLPEATITLSSELADPAGVAFQWRRNGREIPGATRATLALPALREADAGTYTVIARSEGGMRSSLPAVVSLQWRERITNVSVRARVGVGQPPLIAGFRVTGQGRMRLLARGIGEGLRSLGVGETLREPRLTLHAGTTALYYHNSIWKEEPDPRGFAIAAAAGAFLGSGETSGSRAAVLITDQEPGVYTARLEGGILDSGVALLELYDVSAGSAERAKIDQFSARGEVGTGANVMVIGLTLTGQTPTKLLLRAVGPGLGAFGVATAIGDPQFVIFRNGQVVAQNDNWSAGANAVVAAQAAQDVGAFPLVNGSRDAAALVELTPGSYSVHVSGVAGETGTALVEVYELPR